MNLTISQLPKSDTFAYVNGCRIRLGRSWTELVTADELSDRFARTFRELGAEPHVMSATQEAVWGLAERADGTVDMYLVSIRGGMVDATYGGTITPDGERIER